MIYNKDPSRVGEEGQGSLHPKRCVEHAHEKPQSETLPPTLAIGRVFSSSLLLLLLILLLSKYFY